MKEADGCALLKERFARAGFTIVEDAPIQVLGVTVHLDGWDAEKKVGYEYLTTEAHDELEFTPPVLHELEEQMRRGELHVLLIDEAASEEALTRAAEGFLEQLAQGELAAVLSRGPQP
jgi:hypothetical protein